MNIITKLFKALADDNRIRIINMLNERPLCVCEVQAILGISQSSVSHHLKILDEAGLINHQRDGLWINYMLPDGKVASEVKTIHKLVRKSIEENKLFSEDRKNLKKVNRNEICK